MFQSDEQDLLYVHANGEFVDGQDESSLNKTDVFTPRKLKLCNPGNSNTFSIVKNLFEQFSSSVEKEKKIFAVK